MPELALKHLSHSTLAKLDRCPCSLWLAKGRGLRGRPGWAGVGGRAAHSLFEEHDRAGCPEWDRSAWEGRAEEVFRREIATEETTSGVPSDEWRVSGRRSSTWPDKETRSWWSHHLPLMGQAYGAWRASRPHLVGWVTPDGVPAIELELQVSIPGVSTPFVGFVDKVFVDESRGGALVVCDYKSGSMAPEDLSQLIAYASLIEIVYGQRPEFGAIYSARKGQLLPIMRDGVELMPLGHVSTESWIRGVQSREKIIALGEFPAHPGRHCGWCDVAAACTWAKGADAWRHDPAHPAYQNDLALAT